MINTVTQEQFDTLRVNARAYEEKFNQLSEFPKAVVDNDPLARPVIQVLNRNPSLVSIFSCQGHSFEEWKSRFDGKEGFNPALYSHACFNMIFANSPTEEGRQSVVEIEKRLVDFDYSKWKLLRPSLSLISLLWGFDKTGLNGPRVTYPCWSLKLRYQGRLREMTKRDVGEVCDVAKELFTF